MCTHQRGELLEDCLLIFDPIAGKMRCYAHPPPPIPRQRSDAEERLDRMMQGSRWAD